MVPKGVPALSALPSFSLWHRTFPMRSIDHFLVDYSTSFLFIWSAFPSSPVPSNIRNPCVFSRFSNIFPRTSALHSESHTHLISVKFHCTVPWSRQMHVVVYSAGLSPWVFRHPTVSVGWFCFSITQCVSSCLSRNFPARSLSFPLFSLMHCTKRNIVCSMIGPPLRYPGRNLGRVISRSRLWNCH